MTNLTKQAIKASFLKLLNEQPLNKISVRSITADCGLNRNSFYYHFQDIPALLEEIIRDAADALITKYPSIGSLEECIEVAFRFGRDNRRAVLHIFNSGNRDIYERTAMNLCEYLVRSYLDTCFDRNTVSEQDHEVTVRFFKCLLFGLIYDWIDGGMKDDAVADTKHVVSVCRGLSEELIHRACASPD